MMFQRMHSDTHNTDMLLQFANVLYIDAGSVLLRPLDIVRDSRNVRIFLLPQTSDAFPGRIKYTIQTP